MMRKKKNKAKICSWHENLLLLLWLAYFSLFFCATFLILLHIFFRHTHRHLLLASLSSKNSVLMFNATL